MAEHPLVAYLRARWDEEEQRARKAAGDERWQRWALEESGDYSDGYIVEEALLKIRDIAAKRGVLDEVLVYEARIDEEWGCSHSKEDIAAGRCPEADPGEIPALLALVEPYSDRADYPKFRPGENSECSG